MSSGDPMGQGFPLGAETPATNYGIPNFRNNHPVLEFDDATSWTVYWTGFLSDLYAGGGLTVAIQSSMVSAITGTLGYLVAIERVDISLDTDADSFASNITATAATVPGTSGAMMTHTAVFSSGAAMDSLAAGELFRLRVSRDVANDTGVGNAQLHGVKIKET